MSGKLDQLKEILGEVSDVYHAASVLEWDQQVNMPPGGSDARGQQLGTLSKIAHEKSTSDEVGKLLQDLKYEFTDAESDDAALVRVSARNYDKATRVPSQFVSKQAIVTTKAFEAWVEAKGKSDFSIFRPHLEKVVELVQEYISFFPPADHPYDILLDDYEPGMKTSEVKEIFNNLRPKQVELIKSIKSARQVKDDFLHKKYNEKKVWDFSEAVISKFGYDFNRGRQDKAPHPFQTTFSVNDTRITNRFESENPLSTLFSAMHEAGHAMYEQGSNPIYERTPLAGGTSLAVHESQSRMWENLVGRSLPFWEYFFPELKKTFPSQLDGVSAKSFYKAINKVEPSMIRVNADESTYNLHVMLRLELEIGMVEGKFAIKDLPEIWNAKMQDYLGIVPPNDAQGVLQDVHWSSGLMGYFSTYALGNLVSAQLWEKINADITDLDDQIRKGKFDSLLGWLREKVHIFGHKYDPQDLIEKVTGSKIDSAAYVRYLTKKYSDIYGL
ncbi:MAG: carboxypeptidase M32 [Anaerolineales bacterium]|uniref:carboxypeptidase M32 n=1 Tax=Candidatus Villigracilis proximus TaxID=3140683 RepID=UPI003134E2BA|nr:carboxypeptidase M32 [Anaerolineales bacterium]